MKHTLIVLIFMSFVLINCNNISSDGDLPIETTSSMKLIPSKGKTYLMGIADSLDPLDHVSIPICTVSFTYNFYMDSTEVTQKKFDNIMSDSIHGFEGYIKPGWSSIFGIGDSLPAYKVSWNQAIIYCNILSKINNFDTVYSYDSIVIESNGGIDIYNLIADFSKQGYRLPTEEEWEFAARAGITTDFYWGSVDEEYPLTSNDSNEIDKHMVWFHNSFDLWASHPDHGPHNVASKLPNNYGLYDMLGNLAEMCYSDYEATFPSKSIDPIGQNNSIDKPFRGGSWVGSSILEYRFSFKWDYYSTWLSERYGFRVVINEEIPSSWK